MRTSPSNLYAHDYFVGKVVKKMPDFIIFKYSWFKIFISYVQKSDSVLYIHTHTHTYILNETIIWGKYYYHFMVQRGLCSLPKITWLVSNGTEIQTNLASVTLHIILTLARMFCSQNRFFAL